MVKCLKIFLFVLKATASALEVFRVGGILFNPASTLTLTLKQHSLRKDRLRPRVLLTPH